MKFGMPVRWYSNVPELRLGERRDRQAQLSHLSRAVAMLGRSSAKGGYALFADVKRRNTKNDKTILDYTRHLLATTR